MIDQFPPHPRLAAEEEVLGLGEDRCQLRIELWGTTGECIKIGSLEEVSSWAKGTHKEGKGKDHVKSGSRRVGTCR